ncbi:MAG: histidine--tRNA ligase [Cyclobacteriaceae bacterium]|nr:histidine--tRNA ligase [Cyclobacteriaceae bacterium]
MDRPTLPKGTRDFGPAVMAKRQFIFQTIRSVFERYGFLPLETPAMENLSTLTGKYGEEGDQLLFKVLNSGDFLKEADEALLSSRDSRRLTPVIAEKGLKYDLTVPFARYVVMNRHEITFPFKRYQIQPVWRADRPQKGRYREFYQCDADVIGTDSLVCEAEIILMIRDVFAKLGILTYSIKINHRGVLAGLARLAGAWNQEGALFVAIDKLDKIGEDGVKTELINRGFSPDALTDLFSVLHAKGTNPEKLALLRNKLGNHEAALASIADLEKVFDLVNLLGGDDAPVELDISLARGLSYYTGCIFEVKIQGVGGGSVSGGGRYDNLTAVFDAKEKSSGVGFSFGVDRLFDAMEELNLFPEETQRSSQVLVCHLDEDCQRYGLKVVQSLRSQGIAAEIYPDSSKMKKQLEYADKKKIPFAAVIGSDEMKSGVLAVKNLKTGEQHLQTLEQLIALLKPVHKP